ncbi:DUF1090 domain-containing protein [Enterobacter hormaechei]|nr:DUF1090 domain-containing protein [Enterobacter hormaechei]
MNKRTCLATMVTISTSFSVFADSALTGCAAKRHNIEQQIHQAETYGNSHRLDGLKKAYAEVVSTCTDVSLKKERTADVLKKQQKVSEREQELQEANASGRADKIAKKRAKLEEAKDELLEAQAELTK